MIRTIENTAYYNSGDWVESLSALTEDFEGRIELLTGYGANADHVSAPEDEQDEPIPAPLAS